MTEPSSPTDRIAAALTRIETAADARIAATAALQRRHAALRERIEEAVHGLDRLLPEERA